MGRVRSTWWLPLSLVLLHIALVYSSLQQMSMTVDELGHIAGGYASLTLGDYRVNAEAGSLPQRLAALPLLGQGYVFPAPDNASWRSSDSLYIGEAFLFDLNDDAPGMVMRARAAMLLIGALSVLLVWEWSRRLWGLRGAMVSATVCALSPTMIAYSGLANSDAAIALSLTAATGATWVALQRVCVSNVVLAGLAISAALLAKMSGPLIVPMVILMAASACLSGRVVRFQWGRKSHRLRGWRARALASILVITGAGAVSFVGLWAAFGFRYSMVPADQVANFVPERPWETILSSGSVVARTVDFCRTWRLLPEAYLYGVAVIGHNTTRFTAYAAGMIQQGGWWWFYPYVFGIKSALGELLLLLLGATAVITGGRRWKDRLFRLIPLLVLGGVYGGVVVMGNLNIGLRYLLPLMPALFILMGAMGRWLSWPRGKAGTSLIRPPRRHSLASIAVAAGILLLAAETAWTWPHYIAHFNPMVGGSRNGFRCLVDTNLDWGQDLIMLRRWMDRHRTAQPQAPVYLMYFGTARPKAYGVDAIVPFCYLPSAQARVPALLESGMYAISATLLQGYAPGELVAPWREKYEIWYQRHLAAVRDYVESAPNRRQQLIEQRGQEFWKRAFIGFERLRAARLTAMLRDREPDDMAGRSILIYRLTDEDVQQAQFGPSPAR